MAAKMKSASQILLPPENFVSEFGCIFLHLTWAELRPVNEANELERFAERITPQSNPSPLF